MTKYEQGEELYRQGMFLKDIALELKISAHRLSVYLRKRGVPKNPHHYKATVKSTLRTDIFKDIDTKEKAYWLGFIFADGYVSERNVFEVALSIKDISHLEKLKLFLGISNPIKITDTSCRLYVTDKTFVAHLNKHGVVPRKSLILKYPSIDRAFDKAFMMGYFDGDGCLTYNRVRKRLQLSLIGTPEFLEAYKKRLSTTAKLTLYQDKRHKPQTRYISAAGKHAVEIYQQLVDDSPIHLERKRKVFSAALGSNT